MENKYIKTLTNEKIPIEIRNPKKDLSDNEFKLYNLIKHKPLTLLEIRKHLAAYIKGFKNASRYRKRLVLAETEKETNILLDEIKEKSLL